METKKTENKFRYIKMLQRGFENGNKYTAVFVLLCGYGRRRFKIRYCTDCSRYGLGYDDQHCIMVYSMADDKWNFLADRIEIDSFLQEPIDYDYSPGDVILSLGEDYTDEAAEVFLNHHEVNATRFFDACKKFVIAMFE